MKPSYKPWPKAALWTATVDAELLEQQEEIEFALGEDYFDRHKRD
jgi:hypothetical protein